MDTILAIFILLALFMAYFSPSINAKLKNHPSLMPIFIINLFLGWTFLGWVICLAWSFGGKNEN